MGNPRTLVADTGAPSSRSLLDTPVSTIFIWLGLFTVSWDRFGQVDVGSFNLKTPVVCFFVALLLTIVDALRLDRKERSQPHIVKMALLIVAIYLLAAALAENPTVALTQTAVVVVGALFPFLAIYCNLSLFPEQLDQALTAFIRGGLAAAVFGVYQLVAFYTGLPQFVSYLATGGGLGRISSFSYEPGYFGYFLVLVIGALFARASLRGERVPLRYLVPLFGVLILANSRATLLTVPLLLALLFFRKPNRPVQVAVIPVVFFGVIGVALLWLLMPQLLGQAVTWFSTVFDPTENTSNKPRLELFDAAWQVVQPHMLLGVGGGNFRDEYIAMGGRVNVNWGANEFIANNAVLQAILDGGLVLLAAEILLVIVAVVSLYRRKLPTARYLMAGWLSALLVSSMITSYFFDIKLWAVLALACVASAAQSQQHRSSATVATVAESQRIRGSSTTTSKMRK